jgi:ADP-ribose pyrophosphatase YjhB (NUDIX family)
LLSALWKLPGGFLRDGEAPAEGLTRTVREEIGVESEPQLPIGAVRHSYTHFRLLLHIFSGRIVCGRPRPLLCREVRWSAPEDLTSLACSKADRTAINLSGTGYRNP